MEWTTEDNVTEAEVMANVSNPLQEMFTTSDIVRPEQTSFLWWPYLVDNNVNIFGGKAGTGKTWLLCALMAAVTSKAQPPEMPGIINKRGKVLYMGGEDGNGVIAERLEKLGGRSKDILLCESSFPVTGAAFHNFVKEQRPALVIIDPLMSYMDADTNVNDAVIAKQSTDNLRDLARECSTCIVCVIHPPKKEYDDLLHRFIGSGGYIAGARTATFIGYHPTDGSKRIGIQPKNNAIDTNAFVFEIDPEAGFIWAGEDENITQKEIATAARTSGAKGGKLHLFVNVIREVMRVNPGGFDNKTAKEILSMYGKLHKHEINTMSFGQMLNRDTFIKELERVGFMFYSSNANNIKRYSCHDAQILPLDKR